jgi:RNA polymerase sigma factor (sigma-70 family)
MQHVAQQVDKTWRRLKSQFKWTFVDDEASFAQEIVDLLHSRPNPDAINDTQINVTIQQVYNQRVYHAFVAGITDVADDRAAHAMERACEEIRLNALRQARAKVDDDQVAEDIAQKVLLRLIEKPFAVREPGALPAWIKWQILDILKVIRRRAPELSLDGDDMAEPSQNPIPQVDDALFVNQVLNELPAILPLFQLQVIQLVVLQERSAIDAAKILGVTPAKVRTEKARAINKIRRHMGYEAPSEQ